MGRHGRRIPGRRVLGGGLAVVLIVGAGIALGVESQESSPASAAQAQMAASGQPSVPSATPSQETQPKQASSAKPEPVDSASARARSADAVISAVPRAQWRRMRDAGMAYRGCPLTRKDLRRVQVNHVDFDGDVRRGTLVVNADVAASVSRIFTRLFDKGFPIAKMRPMEAYGGDDNASMRANNTSGYNCRRPDQINAPQEASPHANGRAIDINPRQNPWMDPRCRCWVPSAKFAERTKGKGVILRGGLVWRTFKTEGWIWQNIDVPDYQHFDTGYPSKPFRAPKGRLPSS